MVQLDDVSGRRVGARTQPAWPAEAERAVPSRWRAALFVGKAWCFRAERWLRDRRAPAHSCRLPGSQAALGRDATIFWNYVDLRFRPPVDCQLEVALDRDRLTVALRSLGAAAALATEQRQGKLGPYDLGCRPGFRR